MTFPTTFRFKLENSPGFISLEGGSYMLQEHTAGILNTGASADSGNRTNICQRTGFKQPRNALSTEWSGAKVRAASHEFRNDQDSTRVIAENLQGPVNPEPATNLYISTSIAASDL